MGALIFSPRAARDIDEIYDFTAEAWGVVQAESYIATLRQRCEALARGEVAGRDASQIRLGYRRLTAGSHAIFYRTTGDAIEIIRILHARMNFGRHL
jgi:toxin ParE1/3/4